MGWSPLRTIRRTLRRRRNPIQMLVDLAPPSLELRSIVHVGAHLAQERHRYEALGFRDMLWIEGSGRVHAELARSLEEHAAALRTSGVEGIRHRSAWALMTDRDGQERELREFSNDGMSSSIFGSTQTMRRRWPNVHETGKAERVRTRTLDSLLAEMGFGAVDVLVVDVQGAELLVLRGADRVLAEAKAVICEVSTKALYDGGVLFPELAAHLRTRGFEHMSTPRRHGDMLFVHPARSGFGP